MEPCHESVPWGGGTWVNTYFPGTLASLNLTVSARTAGMVAEAQADLLDEARAAGTAAPRGMMFWSESLGSSHIEHVRPRAAKVLHHLIAAEAGKPSRRRGPVLEAVQNIRGYEQTMTLFENGPFTTESLIGTHRVLMTAAEPGIAGKVRTYQNWVGGRDGTPVGADYIPPRPEHCGPLLADLVSYLNRTDHPPLISAAVSHAQFELIHPFGDGNGRAGRVLLCSVMRRIGGLGGQQLPPASLALSRDADAYFAAVSAAVLRGTDRSDAARSAGLGHIIRTICTASRQAASASRFYRAAVGELCDMWHGRIGGRRARSAAHAIIRLLPSEPSVTPASAADRTGYDVHNCRAALRTLSDAGILKPRAIAPAVRSYDADRVIEAYEIMSSTVIRPVSAAAEYRRLLQSAAGDLVEQQP